MSWRPMVSTWRNPAVVTSAALAPLPSRIMLVATVVPCSTRASEGAALPASSSARRMPVRKACDGSLGTDGVLARQIRPLEASCRAMSVKVPPISTAMASVESGKRVDIRVAVKSFYFGTPGAQLARRFGIELVGVDRHAVKLLRRIGGDEAAQHVVEHALRRPVERMAVAAAAAGLDAQHVAALQHVAVAERLQLALVVGAGIDHDAAGAARHAAGDAPGRVLYAVDADREHRLLGQDVVLAHDAATASPAAGAAGVGEDAVGPQAHRIADLEELYRIVLLRHEVDRVGAVRRGARAPADADAIAHQERLELAFERLVGAAHEGDDIGRMRRRRLAARHVDQPVHRREEAHQGEAAHAERRRPPGPQPR